MLGCAKRPITLTNAQGAKVQYVCTLSSRQGRLNNWLSTPELYRVLVLCLDAIPCELPRMPRDRDIEFIIDQLPGTTPIYEKPYRMAFEELVELTKQLLDHFEKKNHPPQCLPLGIDLDHVLD